MKSVHEDVYWLVRRESTSALRNHIKKVRAYRTNRLLNENLTSPLLQKFRRVGSAPWWIYDTLVAEDWRKGL